MARFVKKIWDSRLSQSRDASSHLGMNLSASSHLGINLDLPLIWVHPTGSSTSRLGITSRLGTWCVWVHVTSPLDRYLRTHTSMVWACASHMARREISALKGIPISLILVEPLILSIPNKSFLGTIWAHRFRYLNSPLSMPKAYVHIDNSVDLRMANRRDGTKRRFCAYPHTWAHRPVWAYPIGI